MPKQRNKIDEVTTLDKYEYKVRADEIKALIAEGEYAKAVEIAVESANFENRKYAKKLTKVVAIPNTI